MFLSLANSLHVCFYDYANRVPDSRPVADSSSCIVSQFYVLAIRSSHSCLNFYSRSMRLTLRRLADFYSTTAAFLGLLNLEGEDSMFYRSVLLYYVSSLPSFRVNFFYSVASMLLMYSLVYGTNGLLICAFSSIFDGLCSLAFS